MRVERATRQEAGLVFDWANDPVARAMSGSTEPITWDDHLKWFENQDELWVGWVPVGSVRLNGDEISVNVAPSERGRGYGPTLISAVVKPNTRARIKEENVASLRAFKKARFIETSRENGLVEMVWSGLPW